MPHRSDRPLSKASPPERRSERFTLRRRLTVSLMTVGLASLCLASLVYVAVDTWSYRSALQDRMALLAERAAWRWQLQVRDPAIDGSWAQGLSEDPSVHAAYLFDPEGHTLAAIAPPREAERGAERESWLGPRVQREVFRDGRLLGTVVVQASGAALGVRLLNQAGMFLALAGVSALLTLALSRRIHHRFSDQLLDLAHAANAISTRKDYSIRAVRRSEDEIGMLVDTFNHMITQIEMRDQQLKAEVKRAESARVAKSAFLATMSHEIRTPINGILGMTELLRDTKLSSEQADFARTIHESATGLLSVINDILDFSKGEAGRYEIERVPFELAKVVHECLDTVSIVAAEKELELCLELDERVPARVHGDPSRLRQVLLNLLSNALKFTPRGEIVLRIQLEDLQAKSARVRFEVQDTGIGIPQDRIDRLFQSFSQVDASRSRKYGGTGLGLAISKQIVEAMGGSMFVKTEAGVGSTFGFKLQLPVETGAPEREQNALPHAVRVLIVDPSPTSGAVLARMLKEDNLIELVADGAGARLKLIEAVSAARPFDLILADLRLIDALGSLEVIGAQQAATAPLVVLAPVNQLAAAAAVSWAGRRAALAKPVKRSDLIWCVGEVLRGPLPSQSAPERRPEDPRPAGGQGERGLRLPEGRKVLVAEDHPVNQRITTRFLDKLGVAWELVANGEEALEAVKKRSFDLILMDVQMPVMDGLEATLAIRKLETMSGTHVPIVALTANVLEEHRREAQQAGFDDYLAKPVKLEDLRARILKWLPERALASAA